MNILHYFLGLPPFHSGGLMIYARDLAKEQQKNGNNVIMLMPGRYKSVEKRSCIEFFKNIEGLPIYQITNALPFSDVGISEPRKFMREIVDNDYEKFLSEKNIDIVHIHSLIGLPKEFVNAATKLNIKSYFTSHDYFGLCPQIYLYNYNDEKCIDYKSGIECVKCNTSCKSDTAILRRNRDFNNVFQLLRKVYQYSKLQDVYKLFSKLVGSRNVDLLVTNVHSNINSIEELQISLGYKELRNYYIGILNSIDVLLFNSTISKNEYGKYLELENRTYYVVPVTHEKIKDNRDNKVDDIGENNRIHFGYMGYLDKKKGYVDLVKVLNEIKYEYSEWDISIYGDFSNVDISKFDRNYFIFKGRYAHNKLPEIFSGMDILIIPSKWKETFGFIGLEALSYGVPVMTSNNVGFSDLIIHDSNGVVYDDDIDNHHLHNALVDVIINRNSLMRYKKKILSGDFTYHIEDHYKKIRDIYLLK